MRKCIAFIWNFMAQYTVFFNKSNENKKIDSEIAVQRCHIQKTEVNKRLYLMFVKWNRFQNRKLLIWWRKNNARGFSISFGNFVFFLSASHNYLTNWYLLRIHLDAKLSLRSVLRAVSTGSLVGISCVPEIERKKIV